MKMDLYVADFIEPLASGKLAVMGFYSDRIVVLNVPHDAPEPSVELPFGVNLSLCVTISGLNQGEHEIGIYIEDPNAQRIPSTPSARRRVVVVEGQSTSNAIVPLAPLLGTAAGTFWVVCSFDEEVHRASFEMVLRRSPAP